MVVRVLPNLPGIQHGSGDEDGRHLEHLEELAVEAEEREQSQVEVKANIIRS